MAVICMLLALTLIWSTVSHRNNRIDRQASGVIVGARTFSRSYYCFSNEDIKAQTRITGGNVLNSYMSTSYQLGHKSITASFTRYR